jgi:hypothetical protein
VRDGASFTCGPQRRVREAVPCRHDLGNCARPVSRSTPRRRWRPGGTSRWRCGHRTLRRLCPSLLGHSAERHPQRVPEGRVVQPRPIAVVPQAANRETDATLARQQPQGPRALREGGLCVVMRHRPPGIGSAIRLSVCPPDRSNSGDKLPDVAPAGLHGSALKKTCHGHSRHWLAVALPFLLYPGSRSGRGRHELSRMQVSRTRRERPRAVSALSQQYGRVTEGKGADAIRIARARKESARVRRPRIGRWSPVTHPRSPQPRPPRRNLRTKKSGAVCR